MNFMDYVVPAIGGAISLTSPMGAVIGSSMISGYYGMRQYEMQKEFAKHGVRWRARDAQKAGISPLAALGASGTRYTPTNKLDPIDKIFRIAQINKQLKMQDSLITEKNLQNTLLRQEIDKRNIFKGSHGIEEGFAKMFKYTEMPPDKVIMTLTQEVSESMESDKFAMAMVNWLRGKEIAKGMTYLKPEFLKTMRYLRPPSNKQGYIYKYHRQGYWQLVKMRFPGDDGLFINPKVEQKSKRKVLPPVDMPY